MCSRNSRAARLPTDELQLQVLWRGRGAVHDEVLLKVRSAVVMGDHSVIFTNRSSYVL